MTSRPTAASGTLFTGGDVYNTVDPFATALLLEAGVVAWLGSDDAAQGTGVARDRGAIAHVDLGGDLIAPAFVNARVEVAGPEEEAQAVRVAESSGVLGVQVVTDSRDAPTDGADSPVHVTRDLRLREESDAEEALGWVAASASHRGVALDASRGDASPVLVSATERGVPLRIRVGGPGDLERLGSALAAAEAAHGYRVRTSGHRVDLAYAPDAEGIAALASTYVPVTVVPTEAATPIAELLAAGTSVSLGFGARQSDPWEVLRAAVFAEDGGALSARAAYTAATRGAWRAIGLAEEGVIRMGATARLARWQVDSLVVQASDSRVSAWSTDPRSGTPGLPALDGPAPSLVDVIT